MESTMNDKSIDIFFKTEYFLKQKFLFIFKFLNHFRLSSVAFSFVFNDF